ncbi:hypothetical protein Q7Z28_00650 [Glaesserella parasuis]|uniref:hypothetical protein n=1 Tax=Glaesserella parasuis TaxID=738 RepID=UPI0003ABF19B|nr:hypothetical protein [Glaesserella parasuis]ATW43351.1 hypothetical protein A2U20_05855 [Glaesserella parasuis D74]EQA10816.1 hypothetical protein HPSD74_0516 [Glaesserella parasuis D74]MDO9664766.1 hypothetical protein [Glaesserella parasuis]MDP0316702.1 hypothetical protein [Glaesserella parasuis]
MKTVKAKLTELKNLINKKINKEYEWLGEVKSPEIIKEIEKLYPLIDKLGNANTTIEVSYTKYHLLRLINKATRIINKERETRVWSKQDTNIFIISLIRLKKFIKEMYLIEVEGNLRSDEELSALSADISKVKANLKEHIELEEKLKKDKVEFDKLKNSLINLQTSYEEAKDQASDMAKWHEKISPLNDEIDEFAETAKNNLTKITTLATTAENAKPKIEQYHKEIEEMIKLFNKQKEDIQKIIEDANRASMAGSFKKQMDDINSKMKWADGFLIGALIITAVISLWGFNSSLITQTLPEGQIHTQFDWVQFFAKSAISLPFLIVAWIKSKERAYLFRLREDYGYKYSSAMAFEGYRKQVQEQSPELEEQLLQIAVDNLGSNPTKVFERDLKSTPLETIIDGVGKRLDKAIDGIKGQVKDIPQKTKDLIDE